MNFLFVNFIFFRFFAFYTFCTYYPCSRFLFRSLPYVYVSSVSSCTGAAVVATPQPTAIQQHHNDNSSRCIQQQQYVRVDQREATQASTHERASQVLPRASHVRVFYVFFFLILCCSVFVHKIQQDTRYIRGTAYSCVWRLWVVFLEHGGGALGIFKSPVCTFNTIKHGLLFSASHYFSFLSKRSGRRMPPAERSAL